MFGSCVRRVGCVGTRAAHAAAMYAGFGRPSEVVRVGPAPPPPVAGPGEVTVKVLASPVNPADINTIQGVYPRKPASLPAVGGNEGVGVVIGAGSGVSGLGVGDRVFPSVPGLGWWRTHMVVPEASLARVSHDELSLEAAATLTVNPTSAYRMLADFVDLAPGDLFIQNGANSAVGRAAIQVAAARGLTSVNVVRKRESLEDDAALAQELYALGADLVVTDDVAADTRALKARLHALTGTNAQSAPRLALNCVGGRSSMALAKVLAPRGVHVTYGGMSMRPVTIPTGLLIFKDIAVSGFWMTRWIETASPADKEAMYSQLQDWMVDGTLAPSPVSHHPFTQSAFASVLKDLEGPSSITKPLFVME